MSHPLSTLGIIHTIISIAPLILAAVSLTRYGLINPATVPGKWYVWLTVITCITGFPIMATGHIGPPHYLTILVILLLPVGVYALRVKWFGTKGRYVQAVVMSFTLFLSLIPAVTETLTRVPLSQPLASGPKDAVITNIISLLFLIFLAGAIYQVIKINARKRQAPPASLFRN